MQPSCRLLDHPFYQAWNQGAVTPDQLARYGEAYQTLMDRIPDYWRKVVEDLDLSQPVAQEIIEEEAQHAGLWAQWTAKLAPAQDAPALSELFEALEGMSGSELAGALHAYEVQQPEVAQTKRLGLLEHYGLAPEDLGFFDEHIENEHEHIAFGAAIADEHADRDAFERGFERGSHLLYHSLDAFVA